MELRSAAHGSALRSVTGTAQLSLNPSAHTPGAAGRLEVRGGAVARLPRCEPISVLSAAPGSVRATSRGGQRKGAREHTPPACIRAGCH